MKEPTIGTGTTHTQTLWVVSLLTAVPGKTNGRSGARTPAMKDQPPPRTPRRALLETPRIARLVASSITEAGSGTGSPLMIMAPTLVPGFLVHPRSDPLLMIISAPPATGSPANRVSDQNANVVGLPPVTATQYCCPELRSGCNVETIVVSNADPTGGKPVTW